MPVWFEVTWLFRSLKNGARMPVLLFEMVEPVIVMFEFGPLNTSIPMRLNWKTELVATSRRSRMPLRPAPV